MIFKRNGQLRKEKSIQLVKRVQACLKRFHVGTKLYKHVSDLYQDMQSVLNEVETNDGTYYIPAKQMWIFMLYVLQKYVELLRATSSYCVTAYEHLSCHFSTGMLIPQMLLLMGTVSRIWILSNSIKERARHIYREMFPLLENISGAPSQWVEPPLLPSIDKKEDAADLTVQSRFSDMFKMASTDSLGDVELIPSETEAVSHHLVQSGNDEEDLGEPIGLPVLPVDENSNLRKRPWTVAEKESGKILSKKRKIDKLEKLQVESKKESFKKMKRLLKKGLSKEKGQKSLIGKTTTGKEKKKNKQVIIKDATAVVKKDNYGKSKTSASPQSTKSNAKTCKDKKQKPKVLSTNINNEMQVPTLMKSKTKKKKKKQQKLIKTLIEGESAHTNESKDQQALVHKVISHDVKQKDNQKKKEKKKKKKKTQVSKKSETLLKANKLAKIKPKIDKGVIDKSRSKHKKFKIARVK